MQWSVVHQEFLMAHIESIFDRVTQWLEAFTALECELADQNRARLQILLQGD